MLLLITLGVGSKGISIVVLRAIRLLGTDVGRLSLQRGSVVLVRKKTEHKGMFGAFKKKYKKDRLESGYLSVSVTVSVGVTVRNEVR